MRTTAVSRGLVVATIVLLASVATACGGSSGKPAGPKGTDWSPAARTVDGLSVLVESDVDGLRLHTASGDKTFLPGVNLGSTTPGHQPGEVGTIEAKTYRTWLSQMGGLGIRVVRVYTVHPPAFYDELDRYNRSHERAPIYLVQGVYLPNEDYFLPGKTLYSAEVDGPFTQELADASAAVHGDLVREGGPGRAGGTYRSDVSRWLASWIIGVEWDPDGVEQTDKTMQRAPYTPGKYFAATPEATPTERWISRQMDSLATAEAARQTSVPIAAVNWPTVDPLKHPTERIRGEDIVSVDANHMLPTPAWPGGTFASFHAYPYYPDFLRTEPGYDQTTWEGKPDRYAGYLMALKQHFAPRMPLLISEFGVPSSLGNAHAGTNGRNQGGHSEQEAMAIDASMMQMMGDKGIAGAFVFSWEDEWFKRTWNTVDHQDRERRQLWHDPLTNEEWFGLVATDPGKVVDAAVEATPADGAIKYAYVWADYSWVHLEVTGRTSTPNAVEVAADVLPGPDGPDYRISLDRTAGTASVQVRQALDPIRLDARAPAYRPDVAAPWHEYHLLTNRIRAGLPREYEPVGRLRQGSWDPGAKDYDSRATWNVEEKQRTVRMRIPWSMLGLADPSGLLALGEGKPAAMVKIPGISLDLTVDGGTQRLELTWPSWTRVAYTQRPKAGIDRLERAYRALAP